MTRFFAPGLHARVGARDQKIFSGMPLVTHKGRRRAFAFAGSALIHSCRLLCGMATCLSVVTLHAQGSEADSAVTTHTAVVDGYKMRAQCFGLRGRKAGTPLVVMEAGLTNSLEVWASVLPQIAAFAPVVAYDRAGMGSSEWDSRPPTPDHVVGRLRRLLREIGADPPYLLVGYSWGGTLVRYYAGYFPGEVAGIVYVDPGPILTQSVAGLVAPFDSVGAGRQGYDAFWSAFASIFARRSAAAQAEFDVMRGLMEEDPENRDLRPAPDVPVAVLIAAKPFPPFLNLPYDQEAHFRADLRHRIRMLQEWTLRSPRGTLVISNHTTHAVPREDPELITWAVRRVLSAIATGP